MIFDKHNFEDSILSFTKNSPIDILNKRHELLTNAKINVLNATELIDSTHYTEIFRSIINLDLEEFGNLVEIKERMLDYCVFIDYPGKKVRVLFLGKDNVIDYYSFSIGSLRLLDEAGLLLFYGRDFTVFYTSGVSGQITGYVIKNENILSKDDFDNLYNEYHADEDCELPF